MFSPDPGSPTPLVLYGFWRIFWVGFGGGIIGDVLGFADLRTRALPDYYKRVRYWASAVILAAAGGFVATLYGTTMNGILAMHLGASAPLIIQSFTSSIPRIGGQKID